MTDWIIVGAGFTGATLAERIASRLGQRVLVIDRRDHIGGNAHDGPDADGVLIHWYGPHIFHTNAARIMDYVRPFSAWRPYEHRVVAALGDTLVELPFNLNSIDAYFPKATAARYTTALRARYRDGERVPILKLREEDDADIRELAAFIYRAVFENYTRKQWGLDPTELSPSVTGRVPVLVGRDDRYFTDTFQEMPKDGYTPLIAAMLDHPLIEVALGTAWAEVAAGKPKARVIFTGCIDEYFGYVFGPLPYRTIRFDMETLDGGLRLPAASVNRPGPEPFTRETEIRHITGQDHDKTVLIRDHPMAHVPGETEPLYPIPQSANETLLARYQALAAERDDVIFCGRLGDYRYYNMDQAIGAALAVFDKRIARG